MLPMLRPSVPRLPRRVGTRRRVGYHAGSRTMDELGSSHRIISHYTRLLSFKHGIALVVRRLGDIAPNSSLFH